MDDMTRCELLKTISEYQFVAVELNLYLDTHPGDAAARSDYQYYSTRLMNFGHSATATGCYVCSEWPWD